MGPIAASDAGRMAALCAEVAELEVAVFDGKLLELATLCYSGAKAPEPLVEFRGRCRD
jgi:hypothetical protein